MNPIPESESDKKGKPDGPAAASQPERPESQSSVVAALSSSFRAKILEVRTHHGQTGLYVKREDAHSLLAELRDQHGFRVLTDVTAVDFLNQDAPDRLQAVYIVHNRENREYLRVHAWIPEEDPRIPTVYDLWKSAKWGERECHDMFGIVFEGHPDLRRFLMPEDYPGFPLLKDYPLKGRGERRQFPRIIPVGDEMKVDKPLPYPTSVGREMHTPEFLKEIERDSKPRP